MPTGDNEPLKNDEIESSSNLTFDPPVYIQRYLSIKNILNEEWSRKSVKKVLSYLFLSAHHSSS